MPVIKGRDLVEGDVFTDSKGRRLEVMRTPRSQNLQDFRNVLVWEKDTNNKDFTIQVKNEELITVEEEC